MVFSSNFFIFAFLPLFLLLLFLTPARYRNTTILIASLIFYAAGSGQLVSILLFSIVINHFLGIQLSRYSSKILLSFGIILNLGILGYFKYAGFFWQEFSAAIARLGLSTENSSLDIVLPIGISFFTFQAISYLIDNYNGTIKPAKSLTSFGMYLANFPQLIAGPIVRYSDIQDSIEKRPISVDLLTVGIYRFSIGLGKKILIADSMGSLADQIFSLPQSELTSSLAWLGIIAYTLQIYFDFSGYSDMAIGLGKMMGFNFPENFNQPYRSKSITEFWRRWHMTLSNWFRDYLYIPLGGNRKGRYRTYFNLFAVFFFCGLWHGAAYTFIVWGLFHGLLLTLERLFLNKWNLKPTGLLGQVYALLFVMIGWVFFRSDSMTQSLSYLEAMFGLGQGVNEFFSIQYYLTNDKLLTLILAVVIAVAPFERISSTKTNNPKIYFALVVLALVTIELAGNVFNPFIYFRF
ncbi:MAG: MBOAT family O-acyltransferase [Pseudomonadales bacterium]|nr:MBOAT family O-acyltransferase [Pseudomonadales bacterium]